MMVPKYRTLSQLVKHKKESGFQITNGLHVCGHRMMVCETCSHIFCPDCDMFYSTRTSSCCWRALDAYVRDAEIKHRKRNPRKVERFAIEIEEIGNEL